MTHEFNIEVKEEGVQYKEHKIKTIKQLFDCVTTQQQAEALATALKNALLQKVSLCNSLESDKNIWVKEFTFLQEIEN